MDSISCYHNLQRFRSSVYFMVRFVILEISNLTQWWFSKEHSLMYLLHLHSSVLTSLISRSPWGVHHFKNKICSIGHSEPWHNLLAEPIPLHNWPHLRHTRWNLLAALHLSLHVKSFWGWYVTFQEQSAWPLLIRLEPGHSSWSAYFSQNALT